LQKIGLGLETTSGTAVAATAWIPKSKGLATPKVTYEYDDAAYGVIDKNREAYVTKKWMEFDITDTEPRDVWIGHFLKALYGNAYPCVRFPISSIVGTFSEGETVTETTSSATGVLRRNDQAAGTAALYIAPATGTFTGGQTLTGGTSGATATGGTIISPSTGRHHVFRRLNSNTPPSYTIYAVDPVSADERAAFCVLDTLDFEAAADKIIRFAAKFMGQPLSSTSAQTPAYTSETPFLGKHMAFKLASAYTGLDAASATAIERVKVQGKNNVEMVHQTGGSDPLAPTSLHNTEFEMLGDFSFLYNATTIRDLALAGTSRALRLTVTNTSATAISGSTYPTIQFDFPEVYLNDWSKDSDNGKIVRNSVSFTAVWNVTKAMTSECLLVNTRVTTY
jgi:hypothetical protein